MASNKSVDKRQLLKQIAKKADITTDQAIIALNCLFDAGSVFTSGGMTEVSTSTDKIVELRTPGEMQSVELVREKSSRNKRDC